MKYDVCVLGLGYVGLPTAALLATKGRKVLGVDVRSDVLDKVRSAEFGELEPGLVALVQSAVDSGNLCLSLDADVAETYIIAVPTPVTEANVPNLDAVYAAAQNIAPHVGTDSLIIIESTIPVGTTEAVAESILATRSELRASASGPFFSHCPERVLPGRIVKELVENDRIVGGLDDAATDRTANFYESFLQGRVIGTSARTAELCKLAENAYRDTNIAFANELSVICADLGINVWELIELANRHPRVSILRPGPGVGGHCVAVDPWFIVAATPEKARLIKTARVVNDSKPIYVADTVEAIWKSRSGNRGSVGCLGLTFKADVDDVRESPAVTVIEELCRRSLPVIACDPHVTVPPASLARLENFSFIDLSTLLERADILVILTDHSAFQPAVFDGWDPSLIVDTRGLLEGRLPVGDAAEGG
jgi:UDP-N-acetyl-D-mannosaminuronic acid dehydrogenase